MQQIHDIGREAYGLYIQIYLYMSYIVYTDDIHVRIYHVIYIWGVHAFGLMPCIVQGQGQGQAAGSWA